MLQRLPGEGVTLHLSRDLEGLPVDAAEQAVGFGVAGARIRGGVEMQRAADAVGNVGEVHQRGRDCAFLDWGGEVGLLAAAYGSDEVPPVLADAGARRTGRLLAAQEAVVFAVVLVPNREVSVRPIE